MPRTSVNGNPVSLLVYEWRQTSKNVFKFNFLDKTFDLHFALALKYLHLKRTFRGENNNWVVALSPHAVLMLPVVHDTIKYCDTFCTILIVASKRWYRPTLAATATADHADNLTSEAVCYHYCR